MSGETQRITPAADVATVHAGELVKTEPLGTLTTGRPDWLPKVAEGTEHIEQKDIKIPRLCIAQGLSDQIKRNDPSYIEGLVVGDLFNDLTGEIYRGLPLSFYIVRADPPRFIEFIPRAQGGGVKDLNVPPNDPRTLWTTNEAGERQKPIATMFYDYVILLGPQKEMLALSLKSSGIKIAKQLNGLIKMRNAPLWAGRYTVDVKDETSPNGPFPNYVIKALPGAAGFVQNQEEAAYLKQVFDNIRGKELVIDREPGDDDPLETSKAGQSSPSTGASSDIPF